MLLTLDLLRLVGQKRRVQRGDFSREEGVHEEEQLLQFGADHFLRHRVLVQRTREM